MKLSRLHQDETGAVLVEAAMTLAVFLAVLFGAVIWMITLWQFNTVHYAVDQAARCYALASPTVNASSGSCDPDTMNYVQNYYVQKAYGIGAQASQATLTAEKPWPLVYSLRCVEANFSSPLSSFTIGGIFVFNGNTILNDKTCYPAQ